MKSRFAVFLTVSLCALAQVRNPTAPVPPPVVPELPLDTIVARMGGKAFTAADVRALALRLPADAAKALNENPKAVIGNILLMEKLAADGEKLSLAENTPYKEQLAMMRTQVLAQAMVAQHSANIQVTDEEIRKVFDADPKRFEAARLSVIMIAYVADPKLADAKRGLLTESEARARAADLAEQVREGADFAELAKKYSQDASAARGGEFGTLRRADNAPDEIKKTVFALKPGAVSEPLKFGPGIYIVRLNELTAPKIEDVRDDITLELRNQKQKDWMKALEKEYEVTIEKPEYFPASKNAISLPVVAK